MNTVVTCFPNGKFKCLTMSYDDGVWQDKRLIEIFNRYGIKGTFHLNSAMFGKAERYLKPEEVHDVYQGHEVSCHTTTHPAINRLPLTNVADEVLEDRKNLEAIFGYPVRGMSYPFGSHSPQIRALLPALGIVYSRVVGDTFNFELPADYLQWTATCHHNHRLLEMAERFIQPERMIHLQLFYVWGHSYEFDNDGNWDLMETFCRTVGGKADTWYATNIQIYDYMQVLDRLQFAADNSFVYNPSSAAAWVRVNKGAPVEIKGGALVRLS
ncbi:MAG TPA: polysaccharide deacetylase family protein [Candidatus Limiplasma sp.]|nr:polysaccharide deacetylase family protein [Candidatus Limiplasma sp.]